MPFDTVPPTTEMPFLPASVILLPWMYGVLPARLPFFETTMALVFDPTVLFKIPFVMVPLTSEMPLALMPVTELFCTTPTVLFVTEMPLPFAPVMVLFSTLLTSHSRIEMACFAALLTLLFVTVTFLALPSTMMEFVRPLANVLLEISMPLPW